MKVCLLYRDRDPERLSEGAYADAENILRDLGLKTLARAAGRALIREHGAVKRVGEEDPWLTETMRAVLLTPLATAEEIAYRQEVVRESLRLPETVRALYRISAETLRRWDGLGRHAVQKSQQRNPVTKLVDEIRLLHLFCDALAEIRGLFTAEDPESGRPLHETLRSAGFRGFWARLSEAFPPEREEGLRRVLSDISFYTDGAEERPGESLSPSAWTVKPRIVLECGLEDGLKFSSLRLAEVSSHSVRFHRPGTTMKKLQELRFARIPDSFPVEKEPHLAEQTRLLEYSVVRALVSDMLAGMTEDFRGFFDQLKRQAGFCLGAVQLMDHLGDMHIETCFPEAGDRGTLAFQELREAVMGLERRMYVIGNTCEMDGKDLLIVTGANQGGKSTFLRSIGIAQVMMQCGLPVAAQAYRSGIYPRIFVHFTRREDSAMNSGRLDEELGRMNRIVEQIGEGSLVLLNESFATTTEKEASVIADDITRALTEAGVKVLMVTHLLTFAQRVYARAQADPASRAAFLSAERRPGGVRTYRMVPHAPEMTSFGLDLYDEIVGKPAGD